MFERAQEHIQFPLDLTDLGIPVIVEGIEHPYDDYDGIGFFEHGREYDQYPLSLPDIVEVITQPDPVVTNKSRLMENGTTPSNSETIRE